MFPSFKEGSQHTSKDLVSLVDLTISVQWKEQAAVVPRCSTLVDFSTTTHPPPQPLDPGRDDRGVPELSQK